jgi:hypothetical protein
MGGKHEIAHRFGGAPRFCPLLARCRAPEGTIRVSRPGSGTPSSTRLSIGKRNAPPQARAHIIVYARGPEFSERHHQTVIDMLRESGATLRSCSQARHAMGSREEQELAQAVATGTGYGRLARIFLRPWRWTIASVAGTARESQVVYSVAETGSPKERDVTAKAVGYCPRAICHESEDGHRGTRDGVGA